MRWGTLALRLYSVNLGVGFSLSRLLLVFSSPGARGPLATVGGGLLFTTKTILLTSTISTFIYMGGRGGSVSNLFSSDVRTLTDYRVSGKSAVGCLYSNGGKGYAVACVKFALAYSKRRIG